jgi:hypothetical protein
MLRATLCALLVVAATPLGAQEQKQPRPLSGVKRTLTDRCSSTSIYEYTPQFGG